MGIINHYSMLWGGAIVFGFALIYFLRKGFRPRAGLMLGAIALLLVGGWLFVRPEQATTTQMEAFKANLGQGKAVLLELQSPY